MKGAICRTQKGLYRTKRAVTEEELIGFATDLISESFHRIASLNSPSESRQFLSLQLGGEQREIFGVVFLDSQHRVISFEKLFLGTIDSAAVHPREVVKRSLHLNASAVILAHNHPSGLPDPSGADISITKRITEALGLVDVRVLDHFVIGAGLSVSFAERGLL